MAKITYTDKTNTKPTGANPESKWADVDANEVKQSVNDLYDIVGAGATSDNLIVYSVNTVGDLASVVAGITDASASKIYKIQVRPGSYTTTPVTVTPYIFINGVDKDACIFNANSASDTIFTVQDQTALDSLTIKGATSGKGVSMVVSGCSAARNVNIENCGVGLEVNNASADFDGSVRLDGTLTTGLDIKAGNVIINELTITSTATITTIVSSDSANTVFTLDSFLSFGSGITTALSFTGGSRSVVSNCSVVGAGTGIYITGNTRADFRSVSVFNCTSYGLNIPNVAGSPEINSISGIIEGNTINISVQNANSKLRGFVILDSSTVDIIAGAKIIAASVDFLSGDESLAIDAELHVGSTLRPKESVFGSGDSHINLLAYTESSGGTFTDITTEATSPSSSTFQFNGVDANSAIYVGNNYPATFEGVKINIATAVAIGSGEIVVEYWNGAWTEVNGCVSQSSSPYFKYSKEYFNRSGSYHIKFNPFMIDDWVKNDPITPAVGENLYWIRFRIKTAITTSPVIEQIKVHTNRAEINDDGTLESHMDARTYKKLVVDAVRPIEGSMQNASVYVDENVGVGLENNRFTTTGDLLGVSFELPEDCDTSAPLIFVWKGKFAAAGTVEFTVRRNIVKPGDAYTNSEPVASGNTLTVLTGSQVISAADTREDFRINLDISGAIPSRSGGFGDEIWITLQYSTRGTAGNFDYTKLSANYLSDFNGRHLRQ
jgi:hypothetical protein